MNYVYDVLLNFQKEYYEFFEWNIEDEITHIRKIPIFKISDSDYNTLKKAKIKISNNFINKINNKTEVYKKGNRSS